MLSPTAKRPKKWNIINKRKKPIFSPSLLSGSISCPEDDWDDGDKRIVLMVKDDWALAGI
jgi:hypothetical protein